MSTMRTFQVAPNVSIQEIVQKTSQNLSSQGFQCMAQPMGPNAASITVLKDRDGIKDFVGLGIECRAAVTLNGNILSVTVDSEWTNKIIAIVVGWFLCLIPFITGIVGAIAQNSLPDKIFNAIQMAVSGGGFASQQFTQPQYNQPPQQPQYNQPPQQFTQPPQDFPQAPQQ